MVILGEFRHFVHYLVCKHLVGAIHNKQIISQSGRIVFHKFQAIPAVIDSDNVISEGDAILQVILQDVDIEANIICQEVGLLEFNLKILPASMVFLDDIDNMLIAHVGKIVNVSSHHVFYLADYVCVRCAVLANDEHVVRVVVSSDDTVE